jgi:hypothetical protein
METKPRNSGSLIGGILLIAFGLLALLSQIFRGFNFWGTFWPFIIIGVGAMFFVGMVAGGKSAAPLAIPGSIIAVIGLMLFLQNLTNHWESWAYGWTIILMSVGLGIYIMGAWAGDPGQRESGIKVLRLGTIMFVIFGAIFEGLIFHTSAGLTGYVFPVALILLGLYLVFQRAGVLRAKNNDDQSNNISSTM